MADSALNHTEKQCIKLKQTFQASSTGKQPFHNQNTDNAKGQKRF